MFVCPWQACSVWHQHITGTTDSSLATRSIIYPNTEEHSLLTTCQTSPLTEVELNKLDEGGAEQSRLDKQIHKIKAGIEEATLMEVTYLQSFKGQVRSSPEADWVHLNHL